jgi:large subunit ribosomal protein L25
MSQDLVLTAQVGRPTGTRPSRRLRREGNVPATVYGLGRDPLSVTVVWRDLRQALTTDAGVNALITLDVGGSREPIIVKEIQRHPTRRDVIHVDFLRVDLDVTLDKEVAIELVGEAGEVLKRGGVVEQLVHAVVVTAKPADIPSSIPLDVSTLELDRPLTIGDLKLPAGATIAADPSDVIVQGALSAAGAAAAAAAASSEG